MRPRHPLNLTSYPGFPLLIGAFADDLDNSDALMLRAEPRLLTRFVSPAYIPMLGVTHTRFSEIPPLVNYFRILPSAEILLLPEAIITSLLTEQIPPTRTLPPWI